MKNQKGQALVEFVLLLPVFVFMVFMMIDFGRILTTKSSLESKASDALSLLKEGKSYDAVVTSINKNTSSKLKLNLVYGSDQYATVEVVSEVPILTPGLNLILKTPYEVKVKRVVPYES